MVDKVKLQLQKIKDAMQSEIANQDSEISDPIHKVFSETPDYIFDLLKISIAAGRENYIELEAAIIYAQNHGAPYIEIVRALKRSQNKMFEILESKEDQQLFVKILDFLEKHETVDR